MVSIEFQWIPIGFLQWRWPAARDQASESMEIQWKPRKMELEPKWELPQLLFCVILLLIIKYHHKTTFRAVWRCADEWYFRPVVPPLA